MLKLCGIKKTYSVAGSSLPVLGDISIDFREAEFVSVLGPSGCGKTTLLNIIGGLDKYSDGDLQINGVSTEKYRDRDWDAYRNHSIGFVFQSYNLIGHQSVLDNVAIALKLSGVGVNERRRRAMQALDSVGIADHYKKKPGQLSGGQMQRVAIARALVNNPRIILADEPTGALDTATSVQIMEILKGIAKDRLVIMVTHNPELAREYSTRVVELRDGQIISDSNPFEQIIEIEQDVVESENVEAFDASIEVEVEVDDKGKNNNKNKEVKNSKMTTSMSYLTALKLSFKNLLTKKFRTILTAIAGSIGIIGIALILSISHGMNLYITDFQRDLLGQLPIDIDRAVIRFGESSDDGNVTTGNISPRPPGMPPHFNFISREFIDFATADPILSLTEGGDGVELHYGVHTHILFSPTNTDGSSTGVAYTLPSRRQGSGAATRGAQNIVPFRLPRQNVMDAFYSTVWVNENPSIHHNAIGLTLVLNQQWQVDDSLLQLLFGTVRDVEFEELEGLEFSLAFNDEMFAFDDDRDMFVWNYDDGDDYNFYQIYSMGDTIPMYISQVVRVRRNSIFIANNNGLAFPNDLPSYIAHHQRTQDFASQVISVFTNDTSGSVEEFFDLTRLIAGVPSGLLDWADEILNFGGGSSGGMNINDIPPAMRPSLIALIGEFPFLADHVSEILQTIVDSMVASFPATNLAINVMDLGFLDFPQFSLAAGDALRQIIPTPTLISGVSIYPASFEAKRTIQGHIQTWNRSNPFNEIHWNDFVEVLFDIMGELVDAVTLVLVGISAVSLVVSTLMIGIITYVSVLERTKEIGVLRSLGARKKDIRRIFTAETFLVGLFAGVIGIVVALLLLFPINIIIQSIVDLPIVAVMPVLGAFGLIALSCVLTVVSGFIPSRIAANRDPVKSLRAE